MVTMEEPSTKNKADGSCSLLTPSQALKRGSSSSGQKNNDTSSKEKTGTKTNQNNRNRRRRNKNNKNKPHESTQGPTSAAKNENDPENNNANNTAVKGKKQSQRQRQRGKKKGGETPNKSNGQNSGESSQNAQSRQGQTAKTPANKKRNNRKRKPKKKHPWRNHIPEGTMDPITLEDLATLEYPPFALCADEPYVPVPEWPVKDLNTNECTNDAESTQKSGLDAGKSKDLNRQRLADQWGEHMLPSEEVGGVDKKLPSKEAATPAPPLSQRPLNLFDGRALAFYIVSQLQFIDPFTRRDLTRPELLNLDRYLDKYGRGDHGFGSSIGADNGRSKKKAQKIKVTDAYDAKGITLSSAGAAAATAQGRADIMQQMAQQLLNSLFIGQASVGTIQATPTESETRQQQAESFSLQEQYAALRRQERAVAAREEQQYERGVLGNSYERHGFDREFQPDSGGGGYLIIDDDENPELRGRGQNDFPSLGGPPNVGVPRPGINAGSSLYSASHISGRYGNSTTLSTGANAFPALPTATSTAKSENAPIVGGEVKKTKKSKTLSKISGLIKKTTAEEKQRQWEAREAARRKAMISNLTYGMNPVGVGDQSRSLATAPIGSSNNTVSEEQLQRNRAFAEALGVKPSIQRHYASGWARPTTNDHLDELNAALYPDELILQARDHKMQLLFKLEKRWKQFLNDDKAASIPLNRMDKASRKFVHHYAEFWKLKTESFDPEPKRYIHCVKLLDTRMPQPLLSEVARNWRGPSSALPIPNATRTIASVMNDHTTQQTAGQTSGSDGLLKGPPLGTLQLQSSTPSTTLRAATAMSSSKGDLVAMGEAAVQNSRSNGLMEKERPQLNLLPRSVPLELPSFKEQLEQQKTRTFDLNKDGRKRQEKIEAKKELRRQMEEKKKQVLEDAFASDDEEDNKELGGCFDSDSEWGEEQVAAYDGSDEE